ncbi:MAG: galactose-1-epimerase, partial [Cytophagales bacterium]|nr:galactose-1-epimerase [Cytophagales bacterium]
FVLDKGITKTPERVASAKSPLSGIELQVLTTEPGLQLYGGNFLNGSDTGKNGTYEFRGAFCLETQHFPDSPNQPNFPTVILEPGETYSSQSIYKFILPGGNG